jgi:hypothetical protein
MFTLVRSLPLRQLLLAQAPILALSLVIAELFYKFGSFTLECIAFLATWYVLDLAANFLTNTLKK